MATFPLIPQVVDKCKGRVNFFGKPVAVVAAGGVFDGRGLAAALCLGAAGVWVGTRFIASEEASASDQHKKNVIEAGPDDTRRTIILTGRPARVLNSAYVKSWEDERPDKIRELTSKGIVPFAIDVEQGKVLPSEGLTAALGQSAGGVKEILPASEIINRMMVDAVAVIRATPIARL